VLAAMSDSSIARLRLEAPVAALAEVIGCVRAIARLVVVRGDARGLLPGLGPEELLEPRTGRGVHLARRLVRQRIDDDLPDDRRREAQLRWPGLHHEIALLEHRQRALERPQPGADHGREDHGVDRIAEHRRRLQGHPVGRRQASDARGHQAAQRLRQRQILPHQLHAGDVPVVHRHRARLHQPLEHLLDEERVTPGALAHEGDEARRRVVDGEALLDEPLGVVLLQIAQIDGGVRR
jgi:hypothetical protein